MQDPATGTIYVGDHFAGTVTAFDPSTFAQLDIVTLGYGVTQMSIGDGSLYVPRTDGTLDVLDAATLSVVDTITLRSSLYGSACVSEDTATGRWVVTCGTRSGLQVLECR